MEPRTITLVSGLYFYTRNGKSNYPDNIISELKQSLKINPWYREQLICYADSKEMADVLKTNGLYVHKIFDTAPIEILKDTAHKMKHWIMFEAVKEFNDVIWIDWDTYALKPIDEVFIQKCLKTENPKFTLIQNYWATVNCAIYYLNKKYAAIMEQSFDAIVAEPNDELLWKSVLPKNIVALEHFWLNDFVINIWDEEDFKNITNNTYFLHLKNFDMLSKLKTIRYEINK
ncbi:hypothetical protein [Flavobacterium sp.]|uniref:hypothetical protein n=1 Tax=Flavobacterium sp. TaxID=239 RepID=UPI0026091D06|nr:hypothetical protein [Flavobacterium sp.]